MMEGSVIADLINECRWHDKLPNAFSSEQEKSSIAVRELSTGLKHMISQQQKRYPENIEKVLSALVYKRSAQQRRQSYWRDVVALNSSLKKYQSNNLLELLNTVNNKIEKFNTFFYNLTPEMTLHIASLFLSQFFHLMKMKNLVLNITNKLFGYIQINHWEKLGVFIIGICADIFYMIPDQTKKICGTYKSVVKHFRAVNSRFPQSLDGFDFVEQLLQSGSINSLPDTNKVLTMLSLTNEDLETAMIGESIKKIRNEILENQACEVADIGTAISREEASEEVFKKAQKRKSSVLDPVIGPGDSTNVLPVEEVSAPTPFKKRKNNKKKGKKSF